MREFCPVLGAAAGYLVDGVTGATSGFFDGAAGRSVALRGALTMRYDRYGRRGDTSARGSQHGQHAPGRPEGSLPRGRSTTRRPRRARGRVDRASR